MNKTLQINIYQDPTQHVEEFLIGWQKHGTIEQISDLQYTLLGRNNTTSHLELSQYQITISGQIPSETFMLIDTLAKACGADKVIEGDVVDKNQTQQNPFNGAFGNQGNATFEIPFAMRQFGKITTLSKFKLVLLLVIALPLLLIMIPLIIVFAIFKIIKGIFIPKGGL